MRCRGLLDSDEIEPCLWISHLSGFTPEIPQEALLPRPLASIHTLWLVRWSCDYSHSESASSSATTTTFWCSWRMDAGQDGVTGP